MIFLQKHNTPFPVEVGGDDGTCPLNITKEIVLDESYREEPCGEDAVKSGLCE